MSDIGKSSQSSAKVPLTAGVSYDEYGRPEEEPVEGDDGDDGLGPLDVDGDTTTTTTTSSSSSSSSSSRADKESFVDITI